MSRDELPPHELTIEGLEPGASCTIDLERVAPGLELHHVRVTFARPTAPRPVTLRFRHPCVGVHAHWNPVTFYNRGVDPEWRTSYPAKGTSGAPVHAMLGQGGGNRVTFALSDAINPCVLGAGVHEETATLLCTARLFAGAVAPIADYQVTLRIDARPRPFARTLADVAAWWAEQPAHAPLAVPDAARRPMYSTWYSFHQAVTAAAVEHQCRLARGLGCASVIMDDGWQTEDNARGYAYCGDWQVARSKIPDMAAHVRAVHELGMKHLLWYSVPFVGDRSAAFARFEGKYIHFLPEWGAHVLDPRFPEVREALIETWERAVDDWDLDGLKLDFVDRFEPPPGVEPRFGGGRDHDSYAAAADRLLRDAVTRLRRLKPSIMIEFRQPYVGPAMRAHGNLFRAHDVPNDALGNRVETIDVRLLSGGTAVHADMLMWHPRDSVESAASQLLAVLFSVPQISVKLDAIPTEHTEMLRFWLGIWNEHRATLLDGELEPLLPEALYPAVRAVRDRDEALVSYGLSLLPLDGDARRLMLVNATTDPRLVLDVRRARGPHAVEIRDCRGRTVQSGHIQLAPGLHELRVPPAGLALLRPDGDDREPTASGRGTTDQA